MVIFLWVELRVYVIEEQSGLAFGCVCVCVVSFVTPWSCDMATVQQPYGYMWYIGFVIHISGRNVQLGGRVLWWVWSGG